MFRYLVNNFKITKQLIKSLSQELPMKKLDFVGKSVLLSG